MWRVAARSDAPTVGMYLASPPSRAQARDPHMLRTAIQVKHNLIRTQPTRSGCSLGLRDLEDGEEWLKASIPLAQQVPDPVRELLVCRVREVIFVIADAQANSLDAPRAGCTQRLP